jgi:hydroxymethylglutaryl-CoA synthase
LTGIISYGAYIPMWRISRDEIARASGGASMGGERSIASWDEDSLTLAVEAGLDCLAGFDPQEIDGLIFASVSSPFKEKQVASMVASALDMRSDIYTSDITTSTRAGTQAIKAAYDAVKSGSAQKVLVTIADSRLSMPNSEFEQIFGDGAAAFLIGNDRVVAEIENFASVSNPIPGLWKREEDTFPRVYELKLDRLYGVLKDVPQTISSLMAKCNVEAKDISKFAIYATDPRGYREIARLVGIDPKIQLVDPLFATVGLTGTPHSLLLLASALETAKPDDKIICVSCGEGSDAFLISITKEIEKEKGKHRGTNYVASKRMLPSYGRFLDFAKLRETGWPPLTEKSSVVKYWRNQKWEVPFYGMKCNNCGTLQYPISRCCMICGEKDNHEEVKLAKKGKVFTFTHDYLAGPGLFSGDGINPATRMVVDLDDGCRLAMEMSDYYIDEVQVDMPVELTFRIIHQKGDFKFYSWRARPARLASGSHS